MTSEPALLATLATLSTTSLIDAAPALRVLPHEIRPIVPGRRFAGRVVTAGPVADLIDSSDTTVVHLDPAATSETVAAVADRLLAVSGILEVEIVEDEGDSRLVVTAGMPRADVVRALAAVGADVVGLSSRKHLEEVFLRVIAVAQTAGEPTGSVTERLRQVRAR